MYKKSYYQGTIDPAEDKKKHKPERAIVVEPRFKEPFYKNYDLYDVDGEHGPGSGYSGMGKFKSVKEFIEHHRKQVKNKYKADPSWIESDGRKTKARISLLHKIMKNAIDFSIDEQISSDPIIGNSENYTGAVELGSAPGSADTELPNEVGAGSYESYPASIPTGGLTDAYTPLPDPDGKQETALNFGNDLTNDIDPVSNKNILEFIENKYLNTGEPPLMGMPNGIDPQSDLDADKMMDIKNPYYGTTDSGNATYTGTWI